MTQKHTDPNTFLRNLVTKKGKSDRLGVYLTGVNVVADANADYGYDVETSRIEKLLKTVSNRIEGDWNRVLVETRLNNEQIVHPLTFDVGGGDVTVFFIAEGHEMSAMVFIPTLLVTEFVTEIAFYGHMLHQVASFAGKTPTSVKFTIGAAFMDWEDLVEQGSAREVDVGF
jgi:hypothetical protein